MALKYMPASQLLPLRGTPGVAIVDVRDHYERKYDGHIAGAVHYDSGKFEEKLPELAQELKNHKMVIFHCALSQVRGPTCARSFLRHLSEHETESSGTTPPPEVFVLEKGFNGWAGYGHPFCSCKDVKCLAKVSS